MMLIATTLTALLLVSGWSMTSSATTTTTTPDSCIITLEPENLVIPIGESRSVTYNDGKDYVVYNCTDPSTSTPGDALVCESAKCAFRTSATELHTCQDCIKVYQAVPSCIDADGKDCSDTDMCTNNPDDSVANCCGTCKDFLTAA